MRGFKIYEEARTAHLERLSTGSRSVRLLYRKASYDFEADLAAASGARRRSPLGAARDIFTSDIEVIELNEPLFLRAIPALTLYLLAAALRPLRGARRARVVSYAIENIDIAEKVRSHSGLPKAVGRSAAGAMLRLLLAGYDRIAFGTESSLKAYEALLGRLPQRLQTTIIPALEPVCPNCTLVKAKPAIVFLGAFDDRKGVAALIKAWPAIARLRPDAQLAILGKGPLEREVRAWAEGRPAVSLIVDPSRAEIHRAVAAARVLVLLSRSSARWREQVGLPIVEGLSHGCRIVTTPETGLVEWLRRHGHVIVEDPDDADAAAAQIAGALDTSGDCAEIVRSLPAESGREMAEDWLWR